MEPHINDVHKKDLNILFLGSIFRYASIHFSAAGLKSLNHGKGQKKPHETENRHRSPEMEKKHRYLANELQIWG